MNFYYLHTCSPIIAIMAFERLNFFTFSFAIAWALNLHSYVLSIVSYLHHSPRDMERKTSFVHHFLAGPHLLSLVNTNNIGSFDFDEIKTLYLFYPESYILLSDGSPAIA